MKKLKDLIPRRVSSRNAFYAAILIAIISVVFYSCRKYDPVESFLNESLSGISEKAKISPLELAQWFKKSPVPIKNGKWNLAKQAVINGKHVIRVPISDDAVYVFTKDNENKPMNVYAYKWHNEKPKEKKFTGEVIWFSFQDYKLRAQQIKNGIPGGTKILKAKKDLTALVKNKDKYAVSIAKKVKQIQSGEASISTDDCDIEIPGYSTCYAIAQEIIELYGSIFCFLENGIWINSNCEEQFWNTDLNDALNWMLDPYGNEGTIDRNWAFGVLEDVGVGGGGGGGWEPQWLEYGWSAVYLAEVIEIDESDAEWVNSSYESNRLTDDIVSYLSDMTEDPNKYDIARRHLDLMKADPDYMDYAYEYRSNFYVFYDSYQWWENPRWLEDETNYYLAFDNHYFESLGLYDDFSAEEEDIQNPNSMWTGPTEHIPTTISTANGTVKVTFHDTQDHADSDNPVADRLVDALVAAVQSVNASSQVIKHICVSATTNGGHAVGSNHYYKLAFDIHEIDGVVLRIRHADSKVIALQNALQAQTHHFENFGPYMKKRGSSNSSTTDGATHIHFSVYDN